MASSNKKKKEKKLSESDSKNEAADFTRFIIIESLERACVAKFSLFLVENIIAMRATYKNVNKTWNGNLLIDVDCRRQAENILRIKSFHSTKCKAYPYKTLNTSKGVVRSKELMLATTKEMTAVLREQGMTNIKRITIRKSGEQIQTNTYILTFNQSHITKKVKIGYCLERLKNINVKNMEITGSLAEVRRKRPRPHGRRVLKWKEMSKLPTIRLTQDRVTSIKVKRIYYK